MREFLRRVFVKIAPKQKLTRGNVVIILSWLERETRTFSNGVDPRNDAKTDLMVRRLRFRLTTLCVKRSILFTSSLLRFFKWRDSQHNFEKKMSLKMASFEGYRAGFKNGNKRESLSTVLVIELYIWSNTEISLLRLYRRYIVPFFFFKYNFNNKLISSRRRIFSQNTIKLQNKFHSLIFLLQRLN